MERFKNIINQLEQQDLKRSLKSIENNTDGYCYYNGQRMLNLSSNDYLGLATNIELQKEFMNHMVSNPHWLSFGSGSSRLLTGNTNLYDETEASLQNWYKSESAIFFNSGYHANMGILPALSEKTDLILSDKLCHASIIDGIRLSNADHVRYRHADYEHLESILKKRRHQYDKVFIVSESVFSMDGDAVDLQQLVTLKEKYNAILYVDEAHGVGALGKTGLGLCEEQNVVNKIDIIIGTMGKAMASVGAFAILNQTLGQVLINKARTLIFTTALPSINMAWSKFIIDKMPAFSIYREHLKNLSAQCNQNINNLGFNVSQSYIIPIVVGENKIAVTLAEHLQSKGYLVFPIRPPTVPQGTARLRISLTANLNPHLLNPFIHEVKSYLVQELHLS
ncbi:aminotransferase class I/II-fold pyridoxal phosphate-dependent enzyme [Plebeiibacterium sediminum]|uniref:8-amino-7-oxononanoate synthase n=1 Tax=Plebeiibacterium sediminum TaxID=2992112 RepID=A0AAE3SIK4_9BACT|nr:8-amino-7-oxononanoate synthase [Plebeiobacterium sediminum]MCW3789333.1 8-amino-7-oxononanoate synthase [Plebeiobacterium sediminum]